MNVILRQDPIIFFLHTYKWIDQISNSTRIAGSTVNDRFIYFFFFRSSGLIDENYLILDFNLLYEYTYNIWTVI